MRTRNIFLRMRDQLVFELYTIWLFTRSDIKTIIIPHSVFGTLGALSRSNLVAYATGSRRDDISRLPLVVLWVWIVLLPFNIDNQRRPEAIEEDKLNKSWRPLPSRRLSPRQAFWIMFCTHVAGIILSLFIGGFRQKMLGIVLGWIYNELGAADRSCIAKNAVNALGYVTFSVGAVSVAGTGRFTQCGLWWFAMTGGIVFTTVHIQDLIDVEGDAVRDRKTVPLVIGIRACRWTIAVLVPLWTLAAILFWGAISIPAVISVLLAILVAWRILGKTGMADDKATFRVWNLWMIVLFMMPFASGIPQ